MVFSWVLTLDGGVHVERFYQLRLHVACSAIADFLSAMALYLCGVLVVNFSLASSVDGGSDLVDLPTLSPGERFAVPLQYTSWQLVARPSGPEWRFASECLQWDDVDMASPISDTVVTSRKTSAQQDVFRLALHLHIIVAWWCYCSL